MPAPSDRFQLSAAILPALDRALELEGEAREQFLIELTGAEPEVAQAIRALLAECDELDEAGFLASTPYIHADDDTFVGQRIGAYTIERLIGRGGMGEVWLAARSDGRFEGHCALKFVAEAVSPKVADRFRREGQLLARLAHPNIARLLDAGATEDGRAYLALEYVDGQTIDRYCEALSIDARIGLFVDVVAAVAHAHTQLIIHRDIKPSNVLVTRSGEVKLLDFGIAKLLSSDPTEDAAVTRLEDAVLTPKYAAPEQLLGDLPSTATDVYQLGTLLYVLLTGSHPRSTTSCRVLRGDLDAILAVAMRVEPTERYATAQAFKEDLQRYLRNEPVHARSGATAYRVRKFVNRHFLAVLVSTTAVVGLCAALVFALFEGRDATRQRDVALRELARANAVNDFTTFLLSVAAPGSTEFTAAELLGQSERVIDKQFKDNQPLKAELLATVGAQYVQSERWGEADAVLSQAAALADKTDDPSLQARAYCPLALVKMLNGEKERAQALMTRALAALPDRPEYAQLRAECHTRFSEFGYFDGDGRAMISHATEALAQLQRAPSASPVRRIDAQSALAYGHYLAHEDAAADRLYARTMADFEAVGRERTLAAADVLNNWALVHFRSDIRKAEPLLRRALELRRSAEGGNGVAPSLSHNYAGVLLRLGRFDEALPVFEETIRTSAARQENRIMFDAMMQLADLHIQNGQLQEAEKQLARLIPHMSHPRFDRNRRAQLAYYQGHLAERRGNMHEARERYEASTRTFDEIPEKIALNVDALAGLARSELAAGNAQAGTRAAQHALQLARTLGEPGVPSHLLGTALLAVGDSQRAGGVLELSRTSYQQALQNLQETLGPEHALTEQARLKAER